MQADEFSIKYDALRAQYVVERGEVRVVPTASAQDPLAYVKARKLAEALNRVYAEPEAFTHGADEHHFADGSPRSEAREWFEAQRAEVVRKLHDVRATTRREER